MSRPRPEPEVDLRKLGRPGGPQAIPGRIISTGGMLERIVGQLFDEAELARQRYRNAQPGGFAQAIVQEQYETWMRAICVVAGIDGELASRILEARYDGHQDGVDAAAADPYQAPGP